MLARARARVRSRASEHAHAHMSAISSAPLTDRGHKVTSEARVPFQVHWFTGVSYLSAEDTLQHVHDVAGASLLALRFGRMGYKSAYQAVELPGLMVLCDPGEPDTMPSVCLVVPGESCEALGWQRLQALSAPFKPTRVDLAFDDFPFSPSEVKALILNGSVRTRAQRHTVKYHEDFAKTDEGSLEPSQTVSLGSRGSSAFFRCYNSRGFNRGELELKGERAVAAYELLQSPLDLAREMAISFMRGFVDFVDPDSDSNKSRQECLLRWMVWFRWVARSNFQLPPRPAQTLERVWNWFDRQLASMVAVLNESDSSRFNTALVSARDQRWTAKHRLLLGCASGGFA
jgi:hypothetical protein